MGLLWGCSLNTQIERLHWQLALSQMLRTVAASERSAQQDVLAQLEKLVLVKDAEVQLKQLQDNLEQLLKLQNPEVLLTASCPATSDIEDAPITMPYLRMGVGVGLIGAVMACIYLWLNLDRLKEIAPNLVCRCVAQSEIPRPFSQVLAYKTDRWFSTNKYAKVLALLFFTLMLVLIGSLALFAASNASLYEALWSSLAGVGIDWTFSQDFSTSTGVLSVVSRFVSMMISLGGLLVTALLLGIVSGIFVLYFHR